MNTYLLQEQLKTAIEQRKTRSRWGQAVIEDALSLLENLTDCAVVEINNTETLRKILLNGARSWQHYSESGWALCYECDIAKHYCTPTELIKAKNGHKYPNKYETWIDVQSRALLQASYIIFEEYRKIEQA